MSARSEANAPRLDLVGKRVRAWVSDDDESETVIGFVEEDHGVTYVRDPAGGNVVITRSRRLDVVGDAGDNWGVASAIARKDGATKGHISPLTLIRVARGLLGTSYDLAQQGTEGRKLAIADLQEAQARVTCAIEILRAEDGYGRAAEAWGGKP